MEVPPPDILSFSSPHNDAAITFINKTAVNGVVFQHDRAFDVVASADMLVVRVNNALVNLTELCRKHNPQDMWRYCISCDRCVTTSTVVLPRLILPITTGNHTSTERTDGFYRLPTLAGEVIHITDPTLEWEVVLISAFRSAVMHFSKMRSI